MQISFCPLETLHINLFILLNDNPSVFDCVFPSGKFDNRVGIWVIGSQKHFLSGFDSCLIYIYIFSCLVYVIFLIFFSIMVYYKILNIIPCASHLICFISSSVYLLIQFNS